MKRRCAVILTLMLPLAAAQSQGTVKGPGGYEYTPGLTPAQQAQLRAKLDEQLAPPKVIGRSLSSAITAVLNEPKLISGMVGSLPRDLADALNRAAVRTPVRLILAARSSPGVPPMPRVTTVPVPTASAVTMLATSDTVIIVNDKGVTVYQSAFQATQVHQNVKQAMEALASRTGR